jgi:hypothetical protein
LVRFATFEHISANHNARRKKRLKNDDSFEASCWGFFFHGCRPKEFVGIQGVLFLKKAKKTHSKASHNESEHLFIVSEYLLVYLSLFSWYFLRVLGESIRVEFNRHAEDGRCFFRIFRHLTSK